MVTCSKAQEIIYWDLNLKSDKLILNIFEEEHENVIEVVVFAPLKTAKTITKARMEQNNEGDEQTGTTDPNEENKDEDSKHNGVKDKSGVSELAKKAEDMKKLREKLAKLKGNVGTKAAEKEAEDEPAKEPEQEIEVKDEFVASGARDKRIKIWSARRGT